jgi:hypothetical protein
MVAVDRTLLALARTQFTNNLPNVVKAYDSFTITWQLNSNSHPQQPGQPSDVGWVGIGTTNNPIYLTYADPVGFPTPKGVNLYWTLVHLGSKKAAGMNAETDVIDKVWEDFTDRWVGRRDGTQLTYYKRAADEENRYLRQLLAEGSGQCGTWAALFLRVLRAQGIRKGQIIEVFNSDEPHDPVTGKPLYYDNRVPDWTTGILVKKWDFVGLGSSRVPGYPYKFPDEVRDLQGVKGQGNDNPPADFARHFIVRIEEAGQPGQPVRYKYYDPSYGTGPFDSEEDWENASLDRFVRVDVQVGDAGAKPNDLRIKEITTWQRDESFFDWLV